LPWTSINSYLKRALAESSVRLGITINIYSPDMDVEMRRGHQHTLFTQFMQQNQRTILIIDDCIEDRETYRRYLLQDSSYAYTILEEEYGENGLELCTKVKPDAILLDCFLPDINGLQFLRELKKKNQTDENQIPVVMLTSQEKDAIAAAAIKSGAQEYLVKRGMTPEALRLAIDNALERKRKEQTLRQSEEKYRLLAETTPQFVWIAQPGGSIEYCNRYWYDYTGLTAVQTLGSGWVSVLHPGDRESALEHWY
jgi:CheY-like chemotaxis protein